MVRSAAGAGHNRDMAVRGDNAFGEWLRGLMDKHRLTLRGARARTGMAHTTLQDLLYGRRPTVETVVRIARGFHEDVPNALRLAGYDEFADMWQPESSADGAVRESDLSYEALPDDEQEVVSYYHGLADALKPAALAQLKALYEAAPRDPEAGRTHGKRAEDGQDESGGTGA